MNELKTIAQVADALGEPTPRVEYIIRKHRIKCSERIGLVRLFNPEQAAAIRQGLFKMQIRGNHK